MKFLEFKGGKQGVQVFIIPETVVWIQTDVMPQEDGTFLTVIGTQDGKEHLVQGALADVKFMLEKQ
ncbi:MAG TPA: hypothetical protein VMR33_16110 [Candidatus Baltobacteraceae bacterium]|jgi:hypothetical protein|nr:hypothetical protein [Candidatus Baltobacteraceae bacterium]